MIVNMVRGNILNGEQTHVAFAVNTNGRNVAGFAGLVSSRFWPELANTGGNKLGDILTHQAGGKTFHALVCHGRGPKGWEVAEDVVEGCLNSLDVPDEEIIGIVLIGAGVIGKMGGSDVFAILGGMARSKRRVVVYTVE